MRPLLTLTLAAGLLALPAAPASADPPRLFHVDTVAGTDTGLDVHTVRSDLRGRERLTDEPGDAHDPAVSSDGTRIAYVVDEATASGAPRAWSLWTAGIDGSHRTRLVTREFGVELRDPTFDPTDTRIAYTAHDPTLPDADVEVVAVSGGESRTIVSGRTPTWSPSGDRLAFVTTAGDEIRVVRPDGTEEHRVHAVATGEAVEDLAWAPASDRLAFVVSSTASGTLVHRVEVLDLGSGGTREVPGSRDGITDIAGVTWTDDGGRLVIEGRAGDDDTTDVVVVAPDGADRRLIDHDTWSLVDATWAGKAPGTILAGAGADGDPATTERIRAGDPTTFALEASRRLWADADGSLPSASGQPALPRASYAVLSRDDEFVDSLAGAALTSRGPLLLTPPDRLSDATAGELERLLPAGATVYLLGGPQALDPAVEGAVRDRGWEPRRLAGETRVETALAVADEVRRLTPNHRRVLLARAYGTERDATAAWADSVTGGAFAAEAQIPVVVTPGGELHEAVGRWLDDDAPSRTLVLGGPSAVSDRVVEELPAPLRVAGATRDDTATEVARVLWQQPTDGRRQYVVVPGYRADGWAYGLAAAGLARRVDAPVLLLRPDAVPERTAAAVDGCRSVELVVAGDASVVGDDVVAELDRLDAC